MALSMKNYFIEKDTRVIFNGEYMEVYIPKFYFDNEIAKIFENKIQTLGIFDLKIFPKVDSKKGEFHSYQLPTDIILCPSSFEKNQSVDLNDLTDMYSDMDEDELEDEMNELNNQKMYVLKFYKGDVFISSMTIEQSIDSVSQIIKLLNSGKLPYNVKYEDVVKLIINNSIINSTNLGVQAIDIELMVSEIYRNKKDLSKPYRLTCGKTGIAKDGEYIPINIKKIATNNSTFTALTGENMKQALITSINKTNNNGTEIESPIEKTIKY